MGAKQTENRRDMFSTKSTRLSYSDLGEATGNKADPNQVSLDMRAAKEQDEDVLRGMHGSRKHKFKEFFPDLQRPDAKDWHFPWR